jgi:hypothetical protein
MLVGLGFIREPFYFPLSVRAIATKMHLNLSPLHGDFPELVGTSANELKTTHVRLLLSMLVRYHLPWLQGTRKGQVGQCKGEGLGRNTPDLITCQARSTIFFVRSSL